MIVVTFAKNAGQWREHILERADWRCEAQAHDRRCTGRAERAHHICFKSQINERWYWILENGIAVSDVCHLLAHETHNGNLNLGRINHAVDVLNCVSEYKLKKFSRKKVA